jgi:hypothetical protein
MRAARGLSAALAVAVVHAASALAQSSWPAQWTVAGRTLVLNGTGTRLYSALRVEVYAAALYLTARSRDADAIIAAAEPKVIAMRYARAITRDQALAGWDYAFDETCKPPCAVPAEPLTRFRALVPAIAAGDAYTFVFSAAGVEMTVNEKPLGRIDDAAFARVLLATWIGPAPPTAALKRGLLGGA